MFVDAFGIRGINIIEIRTTIILSSWQVEVTIKVRLCSINKYISVVKAYILKSN